jgi:hypothetical protein
MFACKGLHYMHAYSKTLPKRAIDSETCGSQDICPINAIHSYAVPLLSGGIMAQSKYGHLCQDVYMPDFASFQIHTLQPS